MAGEIIIFLFIGIVIVVVFYFIYQEGSCKEECEEETSVISTSKRKSPSKSTTSSSFTNYARQFLDYAKRQIRKKETNARFKTGKLTKYEGSLEIALLQTPRLSTISLIAKTAKTPVGYTSRSTYYGTSSSSSRNRRSSLLKFDFDLEGTVNISVDSKTKFFFLRKSTQIAPSVAESSGKQYHLKLPSKIDSSYNAFSNDKYLPGVFLNDHYFVDLIQTSSKHLEGIRIKAFSNSITVSIRFENAYIVDFNYAWSLFRHTTRICNQISKTTGSKIAKESLFIPPEPTFSAKVFPQQAVKEKIAVIPKKEKVKTSVEPTTQPIKVKQPTPQVTQAVQTQVSPSSVDLPETFSTSSLKAFERLKYRVRSIQTKKESVQIILYSGRINFLEIKVKNGEMAVIGKGKMRQPKDLVIEIIFDPQNQTSSFDFMKPWNQMEVKVTPEETKKVILSKTMLARAIAKYEGKFNLNINASAEPSYLSVKLTFTEAEKNILLTLDVLKEINWMIDYI